MSNCNDTNNPCGQPCNDCLDQNPCYETGCLTSPPFDCVTTPGNWPNIGVTNDMTGKEVLGAIDNAVKELQIGLSGGGTDDGIPDADDAVKVSSSDISSGYLSSKMADGKHTKVAVLGAGGTNQKLIVNVTPTTLVSKEEDNVLHLGNDGLFKVILPELNGKVYAQGEGIEFSDAAGTPEDPIIISTETSGVIVLKPCFDGEWKNLSMNSITNPDIQVVTGQPQYRIRYDGTVEFKGSVTFVVKFGSYTSSTSRHSLLIGSIPQSCLSLTQLAGTDDLKAINYIEPYQPSGDLISQQYNYIIRKSNQNIGLEFQSSFSANTTKTIVVNFDGATFHPNI